MQYNFGNPYGYAPQYGQQYGAVPRYQQPQYGMPNMMPQQPMQSADFPIQELRFVNEAEASAYIVAPNTSALLIDKQSGVAHVKSADATGKSFAKHFRFVEVNEDGTPKKDEIAQTIDMSDFLKKSDIEAMGFVTAEQHKQMLSKIEELQKQLSNMRGNGKPNQQH